MGQYSHDEKQKITEMQNAAPKYKQPLAAICKNLLLVGSFVKRLNSFGSCALDRRLKIDRV
jgi:hypothetical protein